MRTLWADDHPSFHGEFVSFDGIQCRPQPMQRPGPPIHASGMSTAARRRAVVRGGGLVRVLPRRRSDAEAVDELTHLHNEVERPPSLGALEITITPPPGPIDLETVRQFEDLGVHRLVLMRDFTDMAGGPDDTLRTAVLDDMAAVAERLGVS